ncbi:MAG: hypothetical protein ACOVN7_11430 [Rubrivivax sp.]|jgi:hypothetical protein
MGPIDAFWHLLNFFTPAVGVGCLGAAAVKWLWRRELVGVSWQRLAGWGTAGGALALLVGLLLFGRDGRMATYGLVVLAAALAFWGAGCQPGAALTPAGGRKGRHPKG